MSLYKQVIPHDANFLSVVYDLLCLKQFLMMWLYRIYICFSAASVFFTMILDMIKKGHWLKILESVNLEILPPSCQDFHHLPNMLSVAGVGRNV